MSLTPIQELWLHTLVANKEKLGDMKPHWSMVEIEAHPGQATLVDCVWREGILSVRVSFEVMRCAKIEGIEMMQRVLAEVHWELSERAEVHWPREAGDSLDNLCNLLRCVPTNDSKPDVRWRKMQMLYYRHELPYQDLEDRPICGICHGRVATGAGAWSGEETKSIYRPSIHNECYRYARLVLLPIAKAQRQLEKQKATAEADK